MRFRLAQCLCPARHAIFGFAVNDPDTTNDEIVQMIQEATGALIAGQGKLIHAPVEKIHPHCGLCGAKAETWSYEVATSKEFSSWEEAQIALRHVEKLQQRTHALMDALGFSYDAKQWAKKAERN